MSIFLKALQPPKYTYGRVPLSEEKLATENVEYVGTPGHPIWAVVITSTAIIALALPLLIVSTLYVQLLQRQTPATLLTCGHSIEEAQIAGCTFDRMTKTWLPEPCPRYYEEEFVQYPSQLNMTDWKYWTDLTATTEITDEDMAVFAETKTRHETSWVSTMRMHLAHCAFGLMRRASAMNAGERLDLATVPLDHTNHCIELLLEAAMRAPGIDKPIAGGSVIFGAC